MLARTISGVRVAAAARARLPLQSMAAAPTRSWAAGCWAPGWARVRAQSTGASAADEGGAAGLAAQQPPRPAAYAVQAPAPKRPTSAAHPRRGRGVSPRPRNRFAPSSWWRGSRLVGGELSGGDEGDFRVASVEEVPEGEWDERGIQFKDDDAPVAVARVIRDCDKGDFPLREGEYLAVTSKLNPVGALGRSGQLPKAWPPKSKNDRRRRIARELQRQRNATRRVRETAAANERKVEQRRAKARVATRLANTVTPRHPALVAAEEIERKLTQGSAEEQALHEWAVEVFGEEPYLAPPGKTGVSLVH